MSGSERRFFHRHAVQIPFDIVGRERRVGVGTANVSAGGALLIAPVELPPGSRLLLERRAPGDGEHRLRAVVEVVHCLPRPEGGFGAGVRWVELQSERGEGPVREFLEGTLGVVNRRVRQVAGMKGRVYASYEFPSLGGRGLPEAGGSLADALEPDGIAGAAPPAEDGVVDRLSRWFRGFGRRSETPPPAAPPANAPAPIAYAEPDPLPRGDGRPRPSTMLVERPFPEAAPRPPAGARPRPVTSAPRPAPGAGRGGAETRIHEPPRKKPLARNVPELATELRGKTRTFKATLFRVRGLILEFVVEGDAPAVYDNVQFRFPVDTGRRPGSVDVHAAVTRVKQGGLVSLRVTRVEEGASQGSFQATLQAMIDGYSGE